MAEVYILDEYEYHSLKTEIETAEDFEELKQATLRLLECLPVRYSGG